MVGLPISLPAPVAGAGAAAAVPVGGASAGGADAPGAGDKTINLPLAGFAPGEYFVEVKASSGARETTERAAFRVTY